MDRTKTVQDYITARPERQQELILLRDLLLETELEETIKWGAPFYTIGGKNVVGLAAFKSYVGLWFHNGVFLKDPKGVLINANEENTRGLRQWRFTSIEEIQPKLIKQYVAEAIENQKKGKAIKPKPKDFPMPAELKDALEQQKKLEEKFSLLTPFKQKEYKEYIGGAKQEKTRLSRLEKCIPLILEGKGLNDRYR